MATKIKSPLTLNVQHDYITLKTPNGNFTTSFTGAKATGKLATNNAAFHNLDKYVQSASDRKQTFGEAMLDLTNVSIISKLWPTWNEAVPVNDFKVGDNVIFTSSIFNKKYPKGGEVVKVNRKNVYIKLSDGSVCGFDYQTMIKK